jgi:hypothetical protein
VAKRGDAANTYSTVVTYMVSIGIKMSRYFFEAVSSTFYI